MLMKLKFKHQPYQAKAVEAVIECFKGQAKSTGITYRIDPGKDNGAVLPGMEDSGFRNGEITLNEMEILDNIRIRAIFRVFRGSDTH